MELKPLAEDLLRYLVDPNCKTVDHLGQLDFQKRTVGPEVELVDLNYI